MRRFIRFLVAEEKDSLCSRVRLETQCAIPRLAPHQYFVPQASSFDTGSVPLRPARVYLDNEDPLAPSTSHLTSPLSLVVQALLVPYWIKPPLADLVFPLSHSDLPYVLTSIVTWSHFITWVLFGGGAGGAEQRWAVPGVARALSSPSQSLSMKGKILGIVLGR